jgi:hypothetical protein
VVVRGDDRELAADLAREIAKTIVLEWRLTIAVGHS